MTDHKFTDEEVIKALKCCTSSTTSEACNGCPFSETDICEKMSNALEIYALDLINRQKAEIDGLRDTIVKGDYSSHVARVATESWHRMNLERIRRLEEEIDRLKKDRYQITPDGRIELVPRTDIEKIKGEGIKEFAERLTNRVMDKIEASYNAPDGEFYYITDVYDDIDNLVKEMMEGNAHEG